VRIIRINDEKQFVIVGGGLNSLVVAGALLADGVEGQRILIVESSMHLGGQFRSDLGYNDLRFDKGTRILYETGNPRADSFIRQIVERCPSKILKGNHKDVGGIFNSGHFSFGSVYPSFGELSIQLKVKILGELVLCIEERRSNKFGKPTSLHQFLDWRFGVTARELIHEPICRKVFKLDSAELSDRVIDILPLSRLTGLSHLTMMDLANSEELKSRLAFPEQLKLPPIRGTDFCGYYPETLGIQNYVDAAESLLREAGVEIRLECSLSRIRDKAGHSGVIELLLKTMGRSTLELLNGRQVIWTSGYRSLALCAGANEQSLPEDRSRKLRIVHFMVRDNSSMGELYYAYCYDPSLSLFRLTNYPAYSLCRPNVGLFPMTAEFFDKGASESEFSETVTREMGIVLGINSEDPNEVQIVGMSKGVLPVPEVGSERHWSKIAGQLAENLGESVSFPGRKTSRPKFLGRDVVKDILLQINSRSCQ
jgi:protoporphyrinogen oxidase